MIHNPVLRGFEPDPVILRVGDGFYIAASAFEWYPGMRIHHSRDLVNWRPDQESFAGIELQEYERASGKLLLTSRHDPKAGAAEGRTLLAGRSPGRPVVCREYRRSSLRRARPVCAGPGDRPATGGLTEVAFAPLTPDHLAGLTAYYNTRDWHYLYVTAEDDGSPVLRALSCEAGRLTAHPPMLPLAPGRPVALRAELDGPGPHFSYGTGGEGPKALGPALDATVLSDEHADEFHDGQLRGLAFNGAVLGLCVQDLDGSGVHADFAHATYRTTPDDHS